MKNIIIRTFNNYSANCLVYVDGKVVDSVVSIPDNCVTATSAEKYIRKTHSIVGNLIQVNSVNKNPLTYGMLESDFIKLATPVSERGKATRDKITKTVKAFSGTLVYMTADRAVHERQVVVPSDNQKELEKLAKKLVNDGELGIIIDKLSPIESLYAMSETTFKANARLMKDYQHFVD